VIQASRECIEDLQLLLGGVLPSDNGQKERLVERAQALAGAIAETVQTEKDPGALQELLPLNDELLGYIKRVRTATGQGLSISLPLANGVVEGIMSPSPKVDYKGKGRATPQDEEPPVATGRHVEEHEGHDSESRKNSVAHDHASPVERSRQWVAEEAEVFRKGQVLLGPEEMGEIEGGEGAQATGDELRLELLEAEVERPRLRVIDADYDGQEDPQPNGRRLSEDAHPPG